MKVYSAIVLVLGCYISSTYAYSKYGRSCKDIGCRSNEVCVMENDPCSYYQRQNECGAYPTCKKTTSSGPTCATYVCPPGNVCKMSGDNPKCVEDSSKKGHIGYDTHSIDSEIQPAQPVQPSAPVQPVQPAYPQIPTRGETTPRPNVRPQSNGGGNGYRGGSIGSGYPGQPSGYPSQPSGYPSQYPGGYPQQGGGGSGYPGYNGYPGYQQPGGYPQGGYQQPGGYPQGGYQQPGGYPQGGYSGSGGYPGSGGSYPSSNTNQYGNRYGQKSSGSSFSDTFSNTLKNLGTDLLKSALGKIITGAVSRN